MSIDRRGFLGGISALIASPKSLFTQRAAGGYLPAARLISGTVPSLMNHGCIPMRRVQGDYIKLRAINEDVFAKPAHSKVFSKKDIEAFGNSEDTSNISFDFGVSIYSDPSGIFTNES